MNSGKRVKFFRILAGLTAQELADRSGLALSTISATEQEGTHLLLSSAVKISTVLGVSVADLVEDPGAEDEGRSERVRALREYIQSQRKE